MRTLQTWTVSAVGFVLLVMPAGFAAAVPIEAQASEATASFGSSSWGEEGSCHEVELRRTVESVYLNWETEALCDYTCMVTDTIRVFCVRERVPYERQASSMNGFIIETHDDTSNAYPVNQTLNKGSDSYVCPKPPSDWSFCCRGWSGMCVH